MTALAKGDLVVGMHGKWGDPHKPFFPGHYMGRDRKKGHRIGEIEDMATIRAFNISYWPNVMKATEAEIDYLLEDIDWIREKGYTLRTAKIKYFRYYIGIASRGHEHCGRKGCIRHLRNARNLTGSIPAELSTLQRGPGRPRAEKNPRTAVYCQYRPGFVG